MMQFLLAGLICLAAGQDSKTAPSIFDSRPAEGAPAITGSTPESAPPTEAGPDQVENPLEYAIEKMSLREKVSQLMVVTMEGSHAPTAGDLAYLKAYSPGGAIVPKILKPAYAAVYVNKLRGVEQVTGVPLWIGTNIYRLTQGEREDFGEFIQLPSPLSLAAANDDKVTRDVAELLAEHLSLMGFNMHLGPSLEMAPTLPTAEGTVYNLGSDPEFIGNAFNIIREVFNEHGVMAVPLGFPGGGANRPKKSPAVLLTPSSSLAENDLAPYLSAMLAGSPIIHVGNTLAPTLDPGSAPACISEAVIRGLLREKLGYEGIVLAGPMDSQDVAGLIDPAVAAIRALDYGADMIYWNGAGSSEMRAVDNIVLAVEENRLSQEKVDQAFKRVLSYKFEHRVKEIQAVQERKAAPLERQKQLARRVQAIEQQAITVVQNRGGILPLRKESSMPIGVTGTVGVEELTKGLEKHIKPISQQLITTARHVGDIKDFEIQRVTSHIRGIKTVVVVLTDTDRPGGQVDLVKALQEKGVQVVVILLGYPRNLPYLGMADGIVLAYCDASKYTQTMESMADILVGEGPIGFATVTRDIDVRVGESRTFNAYELVRVPPGRLPVTLSETFTVGRAAPFDPQYTLKKVQWDFGDGSKSKDERAVHAFDKPGRYPISLAVTSKKGRTAEYTFHVVAGGEKIE